MSDFDDRCTDPTAGIVASSTTGWLPRAALVTMLLCATACGGTDLVGDASIDADAATDALDTGTDEPGPDGTCEDLDMDGHASRECGGDDCDDTRADVFSGAPEVCGDGVDQDCDGIVDGPMIMGPDTVVAGAEEAYGGEDVVWTGSDFAVLWTSDDSLNLSRVDGAGNLLGSFVPLDDPGASVLGGSAAWTGSALAVAWERDWEVEAAFFDRAGNRLLATTRLTDDPWWSASPHAQWTGSEVVVAWMDSRVMESECTMTSCFSDAFITRMDVAGEEVGDDTRISDESRSGGWPGLAWALWTGTGLGVFWGRHYARTDPAGVESGPDVALSAMEVIVPVWSGSEFGLGWMAGSEEGVFLDRIDRTGDLIDSVQVTDRPRTSDVSIAWTGSEYAVLWSHYGDVEPCGVYLALLPPGEGSPRGVLEVTGCDSSIGNEAIAWSGSTLGVLWRRWGTGLALTRIGMCD